MKITIIVAGTNEPSNSNYLADIAIDEISKMEGATCEKIRLQDFKIDHFTLDCYKSDYPHEEDFVKIQKLIEGSDGLLIATPIWNFGVPAHLKNIIDRIGSFGLDETRSKGTLNGMPFAIIYTGGAPEPAWKGMMRLTTSFVREGLRYFGAVPVSTFFEGKCTKGRGKFGLVVDERPETLERVRVFARNFGAIVQKYVETGQPPAVEKTKGIIMKLGEWIMKKMF
jgi:NAD(P)H-dependent FMN reductase